MGGGGQPRKMEKCEGWELIWIVISGFVTLDTAEKGGTTLLASAPKAAIFDYDQRSIL